MRLFIKRLMPRPKPASKLYLRPERKIHNALKVKDPLRRMTKTPETLKKISFPKIFLLMRHQVGPNPHRHSPKRTKTVVSTKENPNNKAKTRILLPLASTLLLSKRTRSRIRTKRTYPTWIATLVNKKVIMPKSVLKKSQKTSVSLDDLHIDD